ncbi:hypothetical protein GQR58_016587 [Nymphon striatum]|nr:hypothetical protein GQR58_016587 [Nymphon striatum]
MIPSAWCLVRKVNTFSGGNFQFLVLSLSIGLVLSSHEKKNNTIKGDLDTSETGYTIQTNTGKGITHEVKIIPVKIEIRPVKPEENGYGSSSGDSQGGYGAFSEALSR